MINDIGKFLGLFFYITAFVQIIFVFINQYITGNINIPISSIIYIIVGYYLSNHNLLARKIVMVFSGIFILLQFSIFIYFSINGISETANIHLLGIDISKLVSIENIPILFAISIIIPAVPFFLLRTNQAKIEFAKEEETIVSES